MQTRTYEEQYASNIPMSCERDGCEVQIQLFQRYCDGHYIEVMADESSMDFGSKHMMQQQRKSKNVETLGEFRPINQTNIWKLANPIQPQYKRPALPQPPEAPAFVKTIEPPSDVPIQMPRIDEATRIAVKQKCMEQAVHLLLNGDIGSEQFDQLIEEVKTMTVKLYQIVVEKNEHLKV